MSFLRAGPAMVLIRDLVNAHDDGEIELALIRLYGRRAQATLPHFMRTWARLRDKAARPADHWSMTCDRPICHVVALDAAAKAGGQRVGIELRVAGSGGPNGFTDDQWLDMPVAVADEVRQSGIGYLQLAAHVVRARATQARTRGGLHSTG